MLTGNAGDLDFGVILTVPLPFHVVLAPSELDDVDLLVSPVGLDRCGYLASRNEWLTNLDSGIGLDQQHLVELDLLAGLCDKSLDLEGLALLDPVLLAARLNNRIHDEKLREAKFLFGIAHFLLIRRACQMCKTGLFLLQSELAIYYDLIYKKAVLLSTPKKVEAYFNVQHEEDFMKKLVLCVISVAMLSVAMVGCGNSPDGDKQKVSAAVTPSL